jgi:hypothetical protein
VSTLLTEVGTVAHEARRLDRLFPGWFKAIKTDKLDMMDGCMCVLGQGVPGDLYVPKSDAVKADARAAGERTDFVITNYVLQERVPEWTNEIEVRRRGFS